MSPPPRPTPGEGELEKRLARLIGRPVCLVLTDNTRSMISVRWRGRAWHFRLHHMFLDADPRVLEAVAGMVSGNGRAGRERLRSFIRLHAEKIRKPSRPGRPRRAKIAPEGRYFNLSSSFDRINRERFGGGLDCDVTWGPRRKKAGRTGVRLGSYSEKTRMIRVNPVLDRSFVPLYVIDDILNHEMLHCHLGIVRAGGRNFYHHEVFRKMEKAFPKHDRAKQWLSKNLHRLMRL